MPAALCFVADPGMSIEHHMGAITWVILACGARVIAIDQNENAQGTSQFTSIPLLCRSYFPVSKTLRRETLLLSYIGSSYTEIHSSARPPICAQA